jgi:hypothetical protein
MKRLSLLAAALGLAANLTNLMAQTPSASPTPAPTPAPITAIRAHPLKDIHATEKTLFVMKAGQVFKSPSR